jgi:hypothetical protein
MNHRSVEGAKRSRVALESANSLARRHPQELLNEAAIDTGP